MAVVPGRKAGQAALKAPAEMFLTALVAVGLARLSCPRQEGNHTPAVWGISSSPAGAFRGRWWEALPLVILPQAHTSPLFPSTFCTSPLPPGPVCAFQTPFLPFLALCFPLADTQGREEEESLRAAEDLSRQQHKVPFGTPCAFDQPVKGSHKVKKK